MSFRLETARRRQEPNSIDSEGGQDDQKQDVGVASAQGNRDFCRCDSDQHGDADQNCTLPQSPGGLVDMDGCIR
jgi:hypothetical protein